MRTLRLLPLVLLAATALASPSAATAQERPAGLRVVAREGGTGRVLPGAQVVVMGVGTLAVSDSTGEAHAIEVPAGPRLVQVHRLGYQTESFSAVFAAGETVEAEVDMVRAPIELEGVTVTGRTVSRSLSTSGFYARKRSGFGQFIDIDEIKARRPDRLSTLLRGTVGVQVRYCEPPNCNDRGYMLISNLSNVSLKEACPMRIFVDGMFVENANIDAHNVHNIDGVEIYRHTAGLPPQYGGTGATCGVVLIWTRFG